MGRWQKAPLPISQNVWSTTEVSKVTRIEKVRKIATLLQELACYTGLRSVTCHPAELTILPLYLGKSGISARSQWVLEVGIDRLTEPERSWFCCILGFQ